MPISFTIKREWRYPGGLCPASVMVSRGGSPNSRAFGIALPPLLAGPTDGDDKDRSICNTCGFVDYKNPKV